MNSREWFDTSAEGLVTLLPATRGHLEDPGLGEWNVRSLLGHTCRAFTTVENYLIAGATSLSQPRPLIGSPAAYYRAAASLLADPQRVAQRGRDAGQALGKDPATAAESTIRRTRRLVEETPGDAIVITPVGAMRLDDYLPTRAFEITVHGLDLAAATRQQNPEYLQRGIPNAIMLCSQMATPEQALTLLRAITGRDELPTDFTIF
ncbi:maleylpyruvate isomerase N-terminal domain-containing protein [Brevibacterium zhoupengii]|uniref:maleylpyruvate isomerase N-terminal domain-containing protein n=1 Tax=Brevibacterium zhoupengii TaxID=2898795 RepID=UPI001E613120|nr:maleylpyruvate isomerase N-terminal domain-containing protein [Brevibacterium zhoupengii]